MALTSSDLAKSLVNQPFKSTSPTSLVSKYCIASGFFSSVEKSELICLSLTHDLP